MTSAITRYYRSADLAGLAVHPGGITLTGSWKTRSVAEVEAVGDANAMTKSFKSAEQGAARTVLAAVNLRFQDVASGGVFLGSIGEAPAAKEVDSLISTSHAPWSYDAEGVDGR